MEDPILKVCYIHAEMWADICNDPLCWDRRRRLNRYEYLHHNTLLVTNIVMIMSSVYNMPNSSKIALSKYC